MGYMRRRGVIGWSVVSAVMALLYLFSVGWSTWFAYKTNPTGYEGSIQLVDGALIYYSGYYPYRLYVPAPHLEVSPYWGSLDLRILPRYISPSGFREVTIPLWMFAMPVWIVTFLKWRAGRQPVAGTCTKCGYDLRGLDKNVKRCPECGTNR